MNGYEFSRALDASNLQQAAQELYQLYSELQRAGFDKTEAMTLMIAMAGIGGKKV